MHDNYQLFPSGEVVMIGFSDCSTADLTHRKSHRTRPLQKSDQIRSGSASGVYWTNAQKQTHLPATFFVVDSRNHRLY